jgi:hypothetical protein
MKIGFSPRVTSLLQRLILYSNDEDAEPENVSREKIKMTNRRLRRVNGLSQVESLHMTPHYLIVDASQIPPDLQSILQQCSIYSPCLAITPAPALSLASLPPSLPSECCSCGQ